MGSFARRCGISGKVNQTHVALGRPRAPGVEERILEAAHAQLVSVGYARMSFGEVAQEAGVSRPTIYRRWLNKTELVGAALEYTWRLRESELAGLDFDSMPIGEAICEIARRLYGKTGTGRGVRVLTQILAESSTTPELIEVLRNRALRPRQMLFVDALRKLQLAKRIRKDADLELISKVYLGLYLANHLMDETNTSEDLTAASLTKVMEPYLMTF